MQRIVIQGECARYIHNKKIYGEFYNSKDNLIHIANYIPYEMPPSIYLCGKIGNFSPTRNNKDIIFYCSNCLDKLQEIVGE